MRLALAFAILFMFVACASVPVTPTTAFDSRPRYPVTVIPLAPSLSLRHVAGAPCDYNSNVRPPIGGDRTFSIYELVDADGTKLFTAPSMLSDPKREIAEFRAYYRANDQITVLTSNSKNTILIIEDRSPAYPHLAHILLRRASDSTWTWSELDVPILPRVGPAYPNYAKVVGLSDTEIWFRTNDKTWSQPLKETKPRA